MVPLKTASGEVHDMRVNMGANYGLSFSDGVFAHADGQQYHGFVCNPPPMLATEGALQILVWRRVGDSARLHARHRECHAGLGLCRPACRSGGGLRLRRSTARGLAPRHPRNAWLRGI